MSKTSFNTSFNQYEDEEEKENTYAASVPKDRILKGSNPLSPLLRIPGLEVEGLVVHGDGEPAVVFVVDAYNGPFQPDAASSYAAHHFLLRLKEIGLVTNSSTGVNRSASWPYYRKNLPWVANEPYTTISTI